MYSERCTLHYVACYIVYYRVSSGAGSKFTSISITFHSVTHTSHSHVWFNFKLCPSCHDSNITHRLITRWHDCITSNYIPMLTLFFLFSLYSPTSYNFGSSKLQMSPRKHFRYNLLTFIPIYNVHVINKYPRSCNSDNIMILSILVSRKDW